MRYPSTNPTKRVSDLDLKQFQIRLQARLCIALVFFGQFLLRLFTTLLDKTFTPTSKLYAQISLSFPLLICLLIALEHLLYKKRGPSIVRYSKVVDLFLLMLFMADWIFILVSNLNRLENTYPPCLKPESLFGFISFSWRTLIITLVVSSWWIKMLAPVSTTLVVTGYTVYYDPANVAFLLVRGFIQVFNLVLIVYCEDKIKWKLMWTNIQQAKWMEVNNFILNNIPENIMILDFAGETKFVSDYCKNFIEKCRLSLENKNLFKKIQNLQQQQYEPNQPLNTSSTVLHIEKLTTCNGLCIEGDDHTADLTKLDLLEDLVLNFADIIKRKSLQERQFLVYNSKLKPEDDANFSEKSIEVKISFIHNFDNDYIILILRDMTQRDLLVKLEENNRYKDQLLASVSHELRAPLDGNINLVEGAINSPKIPNEIKENLLIPALQSSKFLLPIINDILDMSQIKEKKLRLVFESRDLEGTINSIVELVKFQAKKKGIQLILELDSELPKLFCTDHMRLSQIILNLLSNAIKFTKQGMVKLKVRTTPKNPLWIKISVEDSGIGLSQEKLKKLFSDQTELKGKRPLDVSLGLNIASNLVILLAPKDQQSLNVVSAVNEGSIFSFVIESKEDLSIQPQEGISDPNQSTDSCEVVEEISIPIKLMQSLRMQTFASTSSLPSILSKPDSEPLINSCLCLCPKVLIVDDNPFNIMALETILGSLEIKSDSVYSGPAAIQKLLDRQAKKCGNKDCQQYTIIFMDQEMPEMSGADTVREIKRLQSENTISEMKIIGCTAHKAKEEVDLFLESGLDSCIFKPVSIVMIKDILKGDIIQE